MLEDVCSAMADRRTESTEQVRSLTAQAISSSGGISAKVMLRNQGLGPARRGRPVGQANGAGPIAHSARLSIEPMYWPCARDRGSMHEGADSGAARFAAAVRLVAPTWCGACGRSGARAGAASEVVRAVAMP